MHATAPRYRRARRTSSPDLVGTPEGLGHGRGRRVPWQTAAVLVAFSITPLGTGDSVSEAVADAVALVRASGLPNRTDAMFTTVEGEWDEVMALLDTCRRKVLERAPRVSLVIKVDDRPGHDGALTAKVDAVEAHLRPPAPQ